MGEYFPVYSCFLPGMIWAANTSGGDCPDKASLWKINSSKKFTVKRWHGEMISIQNWYYLITCRLEEV